MATRGLGDYFFRCQQGATNSTRISLSRFASARFPESNSREVLARRPRWYGLSNGRAASTPGSNRIEGGSRDSAAAVFPPRAQQTIDKKIDDRRLISRPELRIFWPIIASYNVCRRGASPLYYSCQSAWKGPQFGVWVTGYKSAAFKCK